MFKLVHDAKVSSENPTRRPLLDQIVRDGARAMLAAALRAEVAAYLDAYSEEVDARAEREVTTEQ